MAEILVSSSSSTFSEVRELWKENKGGGWAAIAAISFIFVWQIFKFIFPVFRGLIARFRRNSSSPPLSLSSDDASISSLRISDLVSDGDLKSLIDNLDEKDNETEQVRWENVIAKSRTSMSYQAKCCKPKDGPIKYLSVTVFENCTPEALRDFYMDCDYRTQWDKTVVAHEQLQIDKENGTEIGRTIKKFPLLTPREYVLAWKIWKGNNKTYYCYSKECEHPLAPIQKKYVRVAFFRSGWRIRQVPGRNASEIRMVHQEDAGLNVEFAKLAFAKGIWGYVCKMDDALRKYYSISHPQSSSTTTAVSVIQKVPRELDVIIRAAPSDIASGSGSGSSNGISGQENGPISQKCKRKPSKKLIANGLLLLGGLICLSHGNPGLGAKVAIACVLKKLSSGAHHLVRSSRANKKVYTSFHLSGIPDM
ncbi:stAR-related lipid transfer protein 7, mitochondrial-like [Chenopodium quinoa]|uniref:stAR-related lipid transfer protein 7, mitochondrial-like n=1 Tax=Chenopodium quinoa TaxID=63459 RepID=UPI000B77EE3F|nr:stAR-related lipid transfer protein 7, mitochondrial-like [Chenopodium quinoa]